MQIFRTFFIAVLLTGFIQLSPIQASAGLDLDRLSEDDVRQVENLLVKLEPLIQERDGKENLATLTFDELYSPLAPEEKEFLTQFQNLDGKALGVRIPFRGIATGKEDLVLIRDQKVKIKGTNEEKNLPPQFLPPKVYQEYQEMMEGMRNDLGKILLIESGYRSSAYQLYLFVYYLKNHDYSIRETVKFVALPGYSEHGSVEHQAIDFINQDGINGEDNPQEFEDLEENKWLLENAGIFGFVLSYPKNAQEGITYEPWHWRYEGRKR